MKSQAFKILSLTLLFTVMLTAKVSPVIAMANSIETIRFTAFTSGPCFIVYGQGEEGSTEPFPPLGQIKYQDPGRGSARIRGYANDVDVFTSDLFGGGYDSNSIQAWGFVSVSWVEDEGTVDEERHWLLAMLYSTTTTYGFFIPDKLFSVPIPGVPSSSADFLRFTGIHISKSETKIIKGVAIFMTTPVASLFPGYPEDMYLINVGLCDEDLMLYQFMWCNQLLESPFGTIPAADVLQWNVEA